jgi:hypothetical protein
LHNFLPFSFPDHKKDCNFFSIVTATTASIRNEDKK